MGRLLLVGLLVGLLDLKLLELLGLLLLLVRLLCLNDRWCSCW